MSVQDKILLSGYLLLLLLLQATVLEAAEQVLDVNGDFKRCVADRNGFPIPHGWQINQKISRGAAFRLVQDPTEVHSGRFALRLSGDAESSLGYVQFHTSFPLRPGAILSLRIQARGRGRLTLGYYAKGNHPERGQNQFIRTITAPAQQVEKPDEWQQLNFSIPLQPASRGAVLYDEQTLTPIIHWRGQADLLIDAFSLTVSTNEDNQK